MGRSSGFGISFGGFENSSSDSSFTYNVPLGINGRDACFHKKGSLEVNIEEDKKRMKGEITIKPAKVEFENVPEGVVKEYFFAHKEENVLETKFYTMSFVCSGEIPLSIEASSDSYLDLKQRGSLKKGTVSVSSTFATGAAARTLRVKEEDPSARKALDFFAKKYNFENEKPADTVCCEYEIPSILSSTSINSMTGVARTITSKFTTMGDNVPNGCASDFSKKMEKYLIQNYKKNDSLTGFEVSKKRFKGEIVLKWKVEKKH